MAPPLAPVDAVGVGVVRGGVVGGGGGDDAGMPMPTLMGSLVLPFGPVQVIGKVLVAVIVTVAWPEVAVLLVQGAEQLVALLAVQYKVVVSPAAATGLGLA